MTTSGHRHAIERAGSGEKKHVQTRLTGDATILMFGLTAKAALMSGRTYISSCITVKVVRFTSSGYSL
jgi:hypothetical protein